MMKICDAHNHWMPPEIAKNTAFFQKGWSDIDFLLDTLDKNGIEKAVLLYPTSDAHLKMGGWSEVCSVYNEEIAREVNNHRERFIGAGILPVDRPQDMLKELGRIKDLGLCCLSLASSYEGKFLDDKIFLPVLEKAEKENIIIFVHSQIVNPIGFERVKDPLLMPVVEYAFDITMCAGKLMMSGVLNRFKNLKIIFSHFAGVLPFLTDRFDATYTMLRGRGIVRDLGDLPSAILRNIYVDISGVKMPAMLKMALDFFADTNVLWGSDFPAKTDCRQSIDAVRTLDIEESKKEKILGGNLINLLKGSCRLQNGALYK